MLTDFEHVPGARAIAVVPTYNERENLPALVEKIQEFAPELHVFVVDDNSPDGTGEVADELTKRNPSRIFALHRRRKEGLGRAYTEGFKCVLNMGYEVIVQMDADLSHDASYLPVFFDRIKSYDLVLGSRYLHGISIVNWDLKRLLLSRLATSYARMITRMPFSDSTGGFKCWRREALEAIALDDVFSNGYLFQIEMTYKAWRRGFKVTEVPIVFFERRMGRSKMNWGIIWEAFWGVLKLRLKS